MDNNEVFSKTKEGEEAVRQRTRLVQRNLRNILIMVDGHSTVAELGKRFGDLAVAESSLAELERNGFIVRAQPEPATTAPAEPPLDYAASKAEPAQEDIPVLTAPAFVPQPQPVPAPQQVVEEIVLSAPEEQLEWSSQPPEPAPRKKIAEPEKKAGPSWRDSLKGSLEGMKARIKGNPGQSQSGMYDEKSIDPVTMEPAWRNFRPSLGWPLLAAMVVAGIVVLLSLAVLLFPYDRYLPDIERQASDVAHDPVKIGRIGFSFLPWPNITLGGIEVGKDSHLTVGAIRVVPDFFSLLGEKKILREVQLDRVAIKNQGLGRIAQWGGGKGGAGIVEIRHISLAGLSLEAGGSVLDGISGEVLMAPGGTPEKIQLRNADATLKLDVQPKGGGYTITVLGNAWKTPFAPGLTFDYLDAQGELGATRLDLSRIDGKLYEGLISGSGSVDWSHGAVLGGDIDLKRLSLARLLAALNPEFSGEGDVSSKLKLESKADSLGKLMDSLSADASFDVKRGAMKGFDLGEAVRSTGRSPTRGGTTRFEQFSGNLQYDQQAYRLTNLRLSSGLMKAGGHLNIGKDRRLNGMMEVEVKGSAALIKAPVSVGGTVKEPWLMPTRGSMAKK